MPRRPWTPASPTAATCRARIGSPLRSQR
uniref:Uncharacterized protein n=1 Tax=Arundo donax TaxID=35708 RepID=A0A0A9BWC6_ARUDO